ncbi:sensor histidine kinase [Candidatus Soleaferrea massiliensis]|uniref:sensor histidine kinase n=1 Tax=Candidatus Soleaferrea massiliensis TaxID=1470354 RepID=UPI0018CE974A|nr:HAMP domain-containing sensor histidine kinase [Candidatus Soleaferrea massiliensis]
MRDYSHDLEDSSSGTLMSTFRILGSSVDADIFLVNLKGNVVKCTEETCVHSSYVIPAKILDTIEQDEEYHELGNLGGIYKGQYYTVGIKVSAANAETISYIFVSSSADGLFSFLLDLLKMFAISSLVVMIFVFFIIYIVTSRMVQPLRQMAVAAKHFGNGDFSSRIPVKGYDEIAQLAVAFNNMASSLSVVESMRRSFVANVSHELKTPMTTIAGFIDGILDGTIPPENQEKYLKIVSDEVKRLARLVRSMLSIAKFESGEMTLEPMPVDISDVILKAVFTFEQRLEAKHIDVRGLDVSKIMVMADRDLIHQVVYNLIENAVKFTNDGGYIAFNYIEMDDITYISIKNSGAGISKEELPHIFDRFYKSDKSRSLDKTGVGLGLYIVRSIINLHSGDIIVRSIAGEYTEFVFTLPHAQKNKIHQAKLKKN